MRQRSLMIVAVAVFLLGMNPLFGQEAQDEKAPSETEKALELIFGKDAGERWKAPPETAKIHPVQDNILERAVLSAGSQATLAGLSTVQPGTEISCRVRLATTEKAQHSSFSIGLAAEANVPADKKIEVRVTGVFDRAITGFNYKPYPTISPVLERTIREPLERDMANVPMSQDRWIQVRLQLGQGWARGWVADRLLWEKRGEDLNLESEIQLQLGPNARIADFAVRSLKDIADLFEPLPLDGYAKARNILAKRKTAVADNALPFGKIATMKGIPFRFVDRKGGDDADHIDVGRSLFRQANWPGYHPSYRHRFIGTSYVDPARIQLRIPNGRYDAMYVLAAFDSEKDSVPVLSASFYRPGAGFPMVFETEIPPLFARKADANAVPVALENRKKANLWLVKIPLDPGMLASFIDMDIIELELTKKVYQYRSYPDPYIYGWHQGGLPSGVHVYAITLHRSPVHMTLGPALFGHVWHADQTPEYNLALRNRSTRRRNVTVTLSTLSHDGTEKSAPQSKQVTLNAGQESALKFSFNVKLFGIHTVTATLKDGQSVWTERRNFCRLAPNTRADKWVEGEGPLFGYWSYHGGHYTAPAKEIVRLMVAAGSRCTAMRATKDPDIQKLVDKHDLRHGPNAWPVSPQWAWAAEEPLDMKKYEEYKKTAIEAIKKVYPENPDMITFFPEPHVSVRLTAGNPPDYWGEKPYEMTEHEKRNFRVLYNTAKAAAEAVRKEWPETKVLIPWGDPLFIVPFLRAGFPKHLIDGSALDSIGFERLPEQQIHQMSTHRLYILLNEYRKFGIEKPFLPYVEGTFVPTEPGACTWDEQADLYQRWTILSLAYGIERFYSGWFGFDCGNYYGAEHYGGCGIQRRIPYNDPKPAYAAYATMTRKLERSKFEKWLPTGSHTVYCLQFRHKVNGITYVLWTLRGKRPVTLKLKGAAARVTDSMDNAVDVTAKNNEATFALGTSPVYVTGAGEVEKVVVGEPDHSQAVASTRARNQKTWGSGALKRLASPEIGHEDVIASLGDGSWRNTDERDEVYETNNYDTHRYRGKMSVSIVEDAGRPGPALAVKLEKQDTERKLMPWYTIIRPKKPVVIPGRAAAVGLWVKAASDWGRVIYCLRDTKGERWISIGTKDEWNCDDVHSWSSFNFDGWRYLRFELPAHLAYDNFRYYGTTFWRSAGGDRIVDLPLSVEKIIVERRSHIIYVNDIQPTGGEEKDVLLGELIAEYASGSDATREAVRLSRIRMPGSKGKLVLPNPIAEMTGKNPLPATRLAGVRDPDWGYDGTRCHVNFDEVAGAAQYQVWVAAHRDGRGAQPMGKFTKSGQLLQGLRPATKFYLWVTYTDKDKKQSKPSNVLAIQLVDAFGMK